MKYKLLTFLGTGDYIHGYIVWKEGGSRRAYPFVQMGILEFFREKYGDEPLKVVVFLTEEAKKENWERAKGDYEGLKWHLEELGKDMLRWIDVDLRMIEVPRGEEALWELFETINGTLEENDRVIFDITHAFRFFPVLTLLVLNYARFVKKVEIIHIFYCAAEVLGTRKEIEALPLEERKYPLFDFAPMAILLDWTYAIEKFLETGNADAIRKIVDKDENLKALARETEGEKGKNLQKLAEFLHSFSMHVYTCRGPELPSRIKMVKEYVALAKKEIELLPVMKPLVEKIEERFSEIAKKKGILQELEIVKWCYEKGLIQQGYTLLRESLVNYILRCIPGSPLLDKTARDNAERILNAESMPPVSIPHLEEIRKIWRSVGDMRNDINHGGMRSKNRNSPDTLMKNLQMFALRIIEILGGEENTEEEKDKNSILGS
ncbi:TIGR02221 family CRISPR-associated protein [bacterium]|nr:MAG: TIGR02221 family CRISPR-associated protein [bacterium]